MCPFALCLQCKIKKKYKKRTVHHHQEFQRVSYFFVLKENEILLVELQTQVELHTVWEKEMLMEHWSSGEEKKIFLLNGQKRNECATFLFDDHGN